MRFEFDALFLDRDSRVVALRERIGPNRVVGPFPGAVSVLELPAGLVAESRTAVGDALVVGDQSGLTQQVVDVSDANVL